MSSSRDAPRAQRRLAPELQPALIPADSPELHPAKPSEWVRVVGAIRFAESERLKALPAYARVSAVTVKAVAFRAAAYADYDSGRHVRPGVPALAVECEIGVRAVETCLRLLVTMGLLTVVRRGGGRGGKGKATEYALTIPSDLLERETHLTPLELAAEGRRKAEGRRHTAAPAAAGDGARPLVVGLPAVGVVGGSGVPSVVELGVVELGGRGVGDVLGDVPAGGEDVRDVSQGPEGTGASPACERPADGRERDGGAGTPCPARPTRRTGTAEPAGTVVDLRTAYRAQREARRARAGGGPEPVAPGNPRVGRAGSTQ